MNSSGTGFYDLSTDTQAECMRDLAEEALLQWGGGFDHIQLLKYRENAVFSVRHKDGRKAALRIHRHGYHSEQELLSELQWMQALEVAGFPVPRIIPAGNGAVFVTATHRKVPEPRQVDMLDWLEGEQLVDIGAASSDANNALYYNIGQLAGQLHNHAGLWPLPEGFSRHAWDVEGLLGEAPLWGRFWDLSALAPSQADLLKKVRKKAQDELSSLQKTPANYGLIHADFVPENLLRQGDKLTLIDFDDAGFGWHMFEIATALFFHLEENYYADMKEGIFKGYRSARSLDKHQEETLPLFLMLRSLTYLGWVHTRHETQTAREMTPFLVERACKLAEAYL